MTQPIKQSMTFDYVLELAFAAQRINGGYIKTQDFAMASFGDVTTNKSKGPVKFDNKDLVRETVSWVFFDKEPVICSDCPHFPLVVTEDDKQAAAAAKDKEFRKFTLYALNDNESDFNKTIYSLCMSEEVSMKDVGFISYIPEFLKRRNDETELKKFLKEFYSSSQHAPNNSVSKNVMILKRDYVNKFETYAYLCGDGTNLYSFFNKNLMDVGYEMNISGRVKKRDSEWVSKLPVTMLNYVKILHKEDC